MARKNGNELRPRGKTGKKKNKMLISRFCRKPQRNVEKEDGGGRAVVVAGATCTTANEGGDSTFSCIFVSRKEAIAKRTVNSGTSGAILSKAGSRQSQGWGTARLEEGGRGVGFLLPSLLIRPRTNERSSRPSLPLSTSLRCEEYQFRVRFELREGRGPARPELTLELQ